MNTKPLGNAGMLAVAGLIVFSLIFSACGSTSVIPTTIPTLSLDETFSKEFVISAFSEVHSPVSDDTNEHLIYGNLPISKPADDLPPELAVFLGRWEGFDYSPPVKKDLKVVLVIQEITPQGGMGHIWSGTNLQYPDIVDEIHFRVIQDEVPSIEWQLTWLDGTAATVTFTYEPDKALLRGWSSARNSQGTLGPIDLTRDRSFHVYKDYAQYLDTKRIYPQEYQNRDLEQYGKGYMLYLPEGYEADPDKAWPLLFFLHGSGDRGDNLFLLPKASPFMMIREKGPLPFIIVAPLLNKNYPTFPEEYMDEVLNETLAEYRVDQKRIYLTGMSMGGESAYRFVLHQPDTFAAVASLCAFLNDPSSLSMEGIKDLPVWAIHGSDDRIISSVWGQQAADALKKAGADVRFTILEGYDHDVWTETYSDPQFYAWFMQYHKP
jgi:predicted esterase